MSDTGSPNLNSKHAWRDLDGRDLPTRSAPERAADFLEIYGLYDEATAREQASRCIQCPNPTCVNGCPLCNPIPGWMQLTAEGRFLEAAAILGSATNLAEICTRVCPSDRLCEEACILSAISEPVSIRALEQFLIEYAFAHNQGTVTAPANGMNVAVIGSGPGGLACADELARRGYSVTIFDAALVPGGLLVNGTPVFQVEKTVLQRRIDSLQKSGVVFRLGSRLWDEITLGQLQTDYDAVFLGFDSRRARILEVPGADFRGVIQAVPFILQKNTALPLELGPVEVVGKRVTVLGAGDTAMDCLRAAIRYGAREAVCIYRRDEADMPCSRREYRHAIEEGARFLFRASPVAILGNESGAVGGVRLIQTEMGLPEEASRRPFLVQQGTEYDFGADLVILALGFEPMPCPHNGGFSDLALNDWGGIIVDANQRTTASGVFAGGDIVRGPTTIIEAVRDARRAAQQIHAELSARISA